MENIETSWYPCNPSTQDAAVVVEGGILPASPKEHSPHPVWSSMRYLTSLWWPPNIRKEKKEGVRRNYVHGVEVRDLGPDHFLCGEKGLFALEKFSQFDVVGEYTGRIVDSTVNGHYVACLEDKTHSDSMGIDAEHCGNEIRFINSYLNVAFKPNVTMRTAYIGGMPHIIVICMEDVDVGEEFLLDYGKSYNEAYLLRKPPPPEPKESMSVTDAFYCLPGGREDEVSDGEEIAKPTQNMSVEDARN